MLLRAFPSIFRVCSGEACTESHDFSLEAHTQQKCVVESLAGWLLGYLGLNLWFYSVWYLIIHVLGWIDFIDWIVLDRFDLMWFDDLWLISFFGLLNLIDLVWLDYFDWFDQSNRIGLDEWIDSICTVYTVYIDYVNMHGLVNCSRLFDWLLDWLIDWLIDWATDWPIHSLLDWVVHSLMHSLIRGLLDSWIHLFLENWRQSCFPDPPEKCYALNEEAQWNSAHETSSN